MIAKIFNDFVKKLREKNLGYIVLTILYVIVFTVQLNLFPLERYHGWDHYWVDVRTAGKLISLENALTNSELPFLDPSTGFGWDLAGDHHSFWGTTNLLVLLFPPATVIFLTQMLFLMLGAIGAYLFLKLIIKDKFISFFGGLSYISIPFVIGLLYYEAASYSFYCIPLFLFLIHKILERQTIKRFLCFTLFSVFAVASSDINSFIIFPTVILTYSFFIAWRYYSLGFIFSAKKAVTLLFLFILASSFYMVPLHNNLSTTSGAIDSLQIAGIWPSSYAGVSIDFISFFKQYGLESMYLPFEGSGLLLYVPAFFYVIIILALLLQRIVFRENPKQISIVCVLIFLGAVMFLGSVVFYSPITVKIFPGLRENATGILRCHINLIPFMAILAGFICLGAINSLKSSKIKIVTYALIIILSLYIDFKLFIKPHSIARPFECSNLIHIYFRDTLHFLPLLNLFPVILMFLYSFFAKLNKNKFQE